jgi:hypothetical protein
VHGRTSEASDGYVVFVESKSFRRQVRQGWPSYTQKLAQDAERTRRGARVRSDARSGIDDPIAGCVCSPRRWPAEHGQS